MVDIWCLSLGVFLYPDRLKGVGDEKYRETYNPESFIEELQAKDMFDLLIGTSTGSILSFGMGYKGLSPQVFKCYYCYSLFRDHAGFCA